MTQIEQRDKLLRKAGLASITVAVFLIVIKVLAWLMSGSVSMLASLIDSSADACASSLNLLALFYALKPADENHPLGHGKAESLSALAQGMFILASSVFLLFNAAERILHPQPAHYAGLNIVVILVSLAATLLLVLYQRRVLRQTRSEAISADHLHYLSDVAANIAVLLAIVLAALGLPRMDGIIAFAIGAWMLYSACMVLKQALDTLMDKVIDREERLQMERCIRETPGILGVHRLIARRVGNTVFAEYHLEFPDDISLIEAHRHAQEAKDNLLKLFPELRIISHFDPQSLVKGSKKVS